MKQLRILHTPCDCGNQGPLEAKYERKLGHDSYSIVFNQSYLGFDADKVYAGRGIKHLIKIEFIRWWIILKALKYDVIHYNFGSNMTSTLISVGLGQHSSLLRSIYMRWSVFMPMIDVWLYRKLGKVICVTFQGGDARQGHNARDKDEEPEGYYTEFADRLKRKRIRKWDKYADLIYYLNPDLAQYLPERAKFLPYCCIELED